VLCELAKHTALGVGASVSHYTFRPAKYLIQHWLVATHFYPQTGTQLLSLQLYNDE
jgi:hypothetical protein